MNENEPAATIEVEVVYAETRRQSLLELTVPADCTAAAAVELSGIGRQFPQIDAGSCELGIWGHPVSASQRLRSGDRVEIYRPLRLDPREARRQLAAHGQSMGGKPGS